MKAVACQNTKLEVADLPAPEPARGQVVLDVIRCGICGSDLHARHHADQAADVLAEAGYDGFMRSDQRVVLGHEFCGEVVDYGPKSSKKLPTGTPVVALPLVRRGREVHAVGLSAAAPGAYAENVLVEQSLMFPLPNGLSPQLGVLTEPMAIGWHAVRRAEIKKRDVAIVIGCGPVGLAVIAMLKAQGVRTIVASDFSRGRRELATVCGADVVVDPSEASPYDASGDHGHLKTFPDLAELGVGTMEKLRRLPVPWHHVMRAADKLGVEAEAPSDLRVRRRTGHPRRRHRQCAPVLARRRGRCVHGARQDPPGDGDQQGDRPAVRRGVHAAGVPRHPAHARRGQGRTRRRSSPGPSACPVSRAPSTRSAIPRRTPRSSSTRRALPPRLRPCPEP